MVIFVKLSLAEEGSLPKPCTSQSDASARGGASSACPKGEKKVPQRLAMRLARGADVARTVQLEIQSQVQISRSSLLFSRQLLHFLRQAIHLAPLDDTCPFS